MSHAGSSQRQESGTNQPIKALRQGSQWVWGIIHRRAIEEENIVINRDLVYNQARRVAHGIHGISFEYLFELITNIRLWIPNNCFEFINYNTICFNPLCSGNL